MSQEFPTEGVVLMYLVVASDFARSVSFYQDVLGAKVEQEFPELCFMRFAGSLILVTVGGDPTKDKPAITFAPPANPDTVSSEFTIRVPDCQAAYEILVSRGAEFLTPPVDWGYEVRAFFRDPDGHLIELSQSRHAGP